MVSVTDHYNVISIDRLPSKTKIGKDSRYFNYSLLCTPDFSSATETCLENTKSSFKENSRTFSKIPPLKKILEFQD